MLAQINIPTQAIEALCQRHHIQELALFGSVLRKDFKPDSDIDILVEFAPDAGIGYQRFFRLQDELEAILGREVDLFTSASLKPFAKETAIWYRSQLSFPQRLRNPFN